MNIAKITQSVRRNNPLHLVVIAHLCFVILLFFSVYFYKERIIFSDSAFQFFKIVNFEKLNTEAGRFSAILPQLPVILLTKLGLNLKLLTIAYSSSFILLYYIIFIICTHLLKNIESGFSILLVLILCINQSFYHPVTETHQSLVYAILFYGLLSSNKISNAFIRYLLSVAAILLAFFAHPVALFPIVFIIGYVAIDKKQLRTFQPYLLLFSIVLLALIKVLITNTNSYEGAFFSELLAAPQTLFNLHTTQSIRFFISRSSNLYFWIIVFELILFVHLLINKKYLKLMWQLLMLFAFMLVTVITYSKGDAVLMMERAFMPLALFVAIPFMHNIERRTGYTKVLYLTVLAVALLLSMNRIYKQGLTFKSRTAFSQNLLKKTANFPNRKVIVEKKDLDKHMLIFWSYSFETLILSTIDVNVPTQTIFLANQTEKYKKYTEQPGMQVFLGADFWLEWKIESLNPKYFSLPTDKPYRITNINELENDAD